LPPLSPDTQKLVLRLFRLHSGLTIMEQAVLRSRLASRPVCMNDDDPPTLPVPRKKHHGTRKRLSPTKHRQGG
jgi:hypothetical protein